MVLELERLGLGAADVLAPRALARAELGRRPDDLSRRVLRVLGVRQLVQAGLAMRFRSRAARRIGAAVDLLHAGSMVALAILDPRRRRGALVQAGIATGFGIGELARRAA
jgi:hypothetical protein